MIVFLSVIRPSAVDWRQAGVAAVKRSPMHSPFLALREKCVADFGSLNPKSKIRNPKSSDRQGERKNTSFPHFAVHPNSAAM